MRNMKAVERKMSKMMRPLRVLRGVKGRFFKLSESPQISISVRDNRTGEGKLAVGEEGRDDQR